MIKRMLIVIDNSMVAGVLGALLLRSSHFTNFNILSVSHSVSVFVRKMMCRLAVLLYFCCLRAFM